MNRTRLQQRAEFLQAIRSFFQSRDVLEVDTPLLCPHTVTDVYIDSIQITGGLYLQTSPEYMMKRLLAAGSGSIFQICKAFRAGDVSPYHNPEFTLLEWYRVGYTHHALMQEMDALLQTLLHCDPATVTTYQSLFEEKLSLNPHVVTTEALRAVAQQQGIDVVGDSTAFSKTTWLQLLFSQCIEPNLGMDRPAFVTAFPVEQAALARIDGASQTASRFEVYYQGIELANGFHELSDAAEQRARFERDQQHRQTAGKAVPVIDEAFLAAVDDLPDCAGVALGLDRLFMCYAKLDHIRDAIPLCYNTFV